MHHKSLPRELQQISNIQNNLKEEEIRHERKVAHERKQQITADKIKQYAHKKQND